MTNCKMCSKEFDENKGFRNECPKAYCSWYCYHDYQHKMEYEMMKKAKETKLEKRLKKIAGF